MFREILWLRCDAGPGRKSGPRLKKSDFNQVARPRLWRNGLVPSPTPKIGCPHLRRRGGSRTTAEVGAQARRDASPLSLNRPCSAPSPPRGRSDLLGPIAVGVGDYFHHVTVGVLEIDAATAVQMIDLAGLGAPRIGVILDALRANAGERRVELGVADKERVVPRTKLFARIEIEGHAVRSLHRDEMAPFRPRLEIEDIGEELGRDPFVLRRDDRVIELDTHLVLPSRFLILSRHRPGRGDLAVQAGRAYRSCPG